MGYDPEVIRTAKEQLEERRTGAIGRAASLRERACRQIPRLREIERELAQATPEVTKAVLEGGDPQPVINRIMKRNLQLQQEMAELLHRSGYTESNFEPQYSCPKCQDTGYENGQLCTCYSTLLQEAACRTLCRLTSMKLTDFDSMRLEYYDTQVNVKMGVSPRQQMTDVIRYCRQYAERFAADSSSLLLQGSTGTGKTHLSLAIAKVVVEKGFGVVYGSVQPLLRRMENEHFGKEGGNSEELLTGCDLLVLDDLGMEFDSPFYRSCVYNLLNSRILEGKPTIISTNLSFGAIQERYGDQITSRLIGGFEQLLCVGKDIRQLIRRQAMLK